MKSLIQAAVLAAATSVCALAAVPPAQAGVGVTLDFGDVAIGYRDGYYDSHHHWHHWRHDNDWQAYRDAHPDHYHDWGHREHHH